MFVILSLCDLCVTFRGRWRCRCLNQSHGSKIVTCTLQCMSNICCHIVLVTVLVTVIHMKLLHPVVTGYRPVIEISILTTTLCRGHNQTRLYHAVMNMCTRMNPRMSLSQTCKSLVTSYTPAVHLHKPINHLLPLSQICNAHVT